MQGEAVSDATSIKWIVGYIRQNVEVCEQNRRLDCERRGVGYYPDANLTEILGQLPSLRFALDSIAPSVAALQAHDAEATRLVGSLLEALDAAFINAYSDERYEARAFLAWEASDKGDETCAKCGSADVATHHEAGCGGHGGCTSHPEQLEHMCRRCRFTWSTPPLDACEHSYPPPNGQGFPVDQCLKCGAWRDGREADRGE